MLPKEDSQLSPINLPPVALDKRPNQIVRQQTNSIDWPNAKFSPHPLRQKEGLGTTIQRQIMLILGVTISSIATVAVWTWQQTLEYEGYFQMLVEPLSSPASSHADNFVESPAWQIIENNQPKITVNNLPENSSNFDYQSQVEILKSPELLQPIIPDLQKKYPEISYPSLVGKNEQIWLSLQPDKLTVKRLKETKIIEVRYRDRDPQKIKFVLDKLAKVYRDYSLPKTATILGKTIEFTEAQIKPIATRLSEIKAEVERLRQTYKIIDPKLQMAQLTEQIDQVEAQKVEIESQLGQQKALYKMLRNQLGLTQQEALKASSLSQSPQYQEVLKNLQEVEANIAIESARFTAKSPQIQALLDRRNNLLPLLRQEAEKVLKEDLNKVNPEILTYQGTLASQMSAQMIETANNIQMLGVRAQVVDLVERKLRAYTSVFPNAVHRLNDLQQEFDQKNLVWQDLSNKLQALKLQEKLAKKPVPWEIVANPTLLRSAQGELLPVSPNLTFNLAIGGLAGLGVGLLLAKIADDRHKKVFHSPMELQDTISLPLLGVIPASDSALVSPSLSLPNTNNNLVPLDTFTESFRSLNTTIRFVQMVDASNALKSDSAGALRSDRSIRSCIISSAAPSDGKSTVAVNLAKAAAAMGQKVLLVDGDLRRPQVHVQLGIINTPGLTNLLSEDLPFDRVIQQVGTPGKSLAESNLYALTAGSFCPDPTQLLSSRKMQVLMERLATNFDLVVYDTPPLLGMADAYLLSPYTNGILLVVGLRKTERVALGLALESLTTSGMNVLGVVANGDRSDSYYHRYHSQYVN